MRVRHGLRHIAKTTQRTQISSLAAPAAPSSSTRLRLITPDRHEYDAARRAWNLAVDQRPAAVCIARSVDDVQAAIAHARKRGLRIVAQITGHLSQTLPSLEHALLLRLALHDGEIAVGSETRTARIEAGARWGDVVDAVAPHGLAVMHGSSTSFSRERSSTSTLQGSAQVDARRTAGHARQR